MIKKLLVLFGLLVTCVVASAQIFNPAPMFFPGFEGPCDMNGVACAEAYSVTRAMTGSYSGPLFQLNNGTTTLNIGQTKSHAADMTTWSAFCSGVASNCTISKVYAQIHTGSNDLTPFNAGAAHRSTFTIEAATGLPLWVSENDSINQNTGQQYVVGGAGDSSTDLASTGINAAGTSETVLMNALPTQNPHGFCCGQFGTAHIWSCCATTGGGDFLIAASWGAIVSSDGAACNTAATYCILIDEECCFTTNNGNDSMDYSTVPFGGVVVAYAFDSVANKMTAYANGVQLINKTPSCNAGASPACTMNSGLRIHYGGGGDLTGQELVEAREMLITNSALTQAQISAIQTNSKTFYPGINFPSGPNNPAIYAAGPGDVQSGATYFNSLRAYTAAIAAAGTQHLVNLFQIAASSHNCDILVNAAGGLGNTVNCTFPADAGQSIATFCSTATSNIGSNCDLQEIFDQTGNGVNVISNTGNHPLFLQYCINFTPCVLFNVAATLEVSSTHSSISQPYTMMGLGARFSNFTTSQALFSTETPGGSGTTCASAFAAWAGSANTFNFTTENCGAFNTIAATAADGAFHTFYGVFNGASSSNTVDGTSTTGTLGPDVAGPNPQIWVAGNSFFSGFENISAITEFGFWPSGLTGTQISNLRANQRAYWGF